MSAYNFALSDWFNPPVIHAIERRDGRIRVEASDNVMVTRVQVTILDEEGKVVEKGKAVKADGRLVGVCYECKWKGFGRGVGFGGECGGERMKDE